jgi:hypothetical protein
MGTIHVDPVVLRCEDAELIRYPADEIRLRAAGHGDIQVADCTSTDRDGPPMHSHPWDEARIVVAGVVEFRIGDADWVRGGSGTVQLLPRGVAHGVRVPEEEARIIQVSVGPAVRRVRARDVGAHAGGRSAGRDRRGGRQARRATGLTRVLRRDVRAGPDRAEVRPSPRRSRRRTRSSAFVAGMVSGGLCCLFGRRGVMTPCGHVASEVPPRPYWRGVMP